MAKSTLFSKNRILSRLSAGDKALLEPDLEPVTLKLRQVSKSPTSPSHIAISSTMGWLRSSPSTATNASKWG